MGGARRKKVRGRGLCKVLAGGEEETLPESLFRKGYAKKPSPVNHTVVPEGNPAAFT